MSIENRTRCFVIEDEAHAEWCGRFATFEEALARLRELSALPWNEPPNLAPCTGWRTCGRQYDILEFDTSTEPWTQLRRVPELEVDARGARWEQDIPRE